MTNSNHKLGLRRQGANNIMTIADMLLIETDARSRVTLPGRRNNQRFLVRENEDGSLLLQPAVVKTAAQELYDTNPKLRALLAEAKESGTVRHKRRPRRTV